MSERERFMVKIALKGAAKIKCGLVVAASAREILEDASGGLVFVTFLTDETFFFFPTELLSIDVSLIRRGSPPVKKPSDYTAAKKRGPKKAKKSHPWTSKKAVVSPAPEKKKRGRPRKTAVSPPPEKKRGRGRPRKNA